MSGKQKLKSLSSEIPDINNNKQNNRLWKKEIFLKEK